MRDLKFRVWDKVNARFVNTIGLALDLFDGELCCSFVDALYVDDTSRDPQDFELLQYTGLKDANGVEIYEGDILATSNDGKDGADIWILEVMGEVYWNEKFACWNHRIALNNDESIYSPQYVKVIGNIHEHPALLKLSNT